METVMVEKLLGFFFSLHSLCWMSVEAGWIERCIRRYSEMKPELFIFFPPPKLHIYPVTSPTVTSLQEPREEEKRKHKETERDPAWQRWIKTEREVDEVRGEEESGEESGEESERYQSVKYAPRQRERSPFWGVESRWTIGTQVEGINTERINTPPSQLPYGVLFACLASALVFDPVQIKQCIVGISSNSPVSYVILPVCFLLFWYGREAFLVFFFPGNFWNNIVRQVCGLEQKIFFVLFSSQILWLILLPSQTFRDARWCCPVSPCRQTSPAFNIHKQHNEPTLMHVRHRHTHLNNGRCFFTKGPNILQAKHK